MFRFRSILALIAAVFLILCSLAHSLLGWKQLGKELAAANAPEPLVQGLMVGWQWGGVAMACFGLIAAAAIRQRLRGALASPFPPGVIGAGYVAFGVWAIATAGEPFFLIFLIPGAVLLAAIPGWAEPSPRNAGR